MAKKKKKPTRRKPPVAESIEEQNVVRLKPFLGMPPGLYLTILYALLILILLFLLLFYKGIRDNGEYLQVTTFPPGASVRIDGRYVGSSPCEVLVEQGDRTISLGKPNFQAVSVQETIRAPVFGTLFVPPRRSLHFDLQVSDAPALVRNRLAEFAENPQVPEILLETAWTAWNAPENRDELYFFIDKAKYFVTNPLHLHTYIHAVATIEAGAGVFTGSSLISTVKNIVQFNQEYGNFPLWLAVVLQDQAQPLVETPWFNQVLANYRSGYTQLLSLPGTPRTGDAAITVRGLRFRSVPPGQLLQGAGDDGFASVQLPHPVPIRAFYMSETEVTNALFQSFVEENPDWAPGNKDALVEQGLVDEDYLAHWNESATQPGWQALPATHVSFHAAEAFCRWLSANLPTSLSGYSARLPFESEWEWSARGGVVGADYPTGVPSDRDRFFSADADGPSLVGSSEANGYGLRDTAGNVWEWCLDWYSPVKYLLTSMDPENNSFDSRRQLPVGAEKVIRGGSWANERDLIRISTRGSQPPAWCTPYLGFRVVIARLLP